MIKFSDWRSRSIPKYNNSVHSSTEVGPFEALFGQKMNWSDAVKKKRDLDVPAACNQAINLEAMQKIVEKQLAKAVASQAKFYNSIHLSCLYNIGAFVYLNSKNINLTRPTKKLDWKFYGPLKIVDRVQVGKVACRFHLP